MPKAARSAVVPTVSAVLPDGSLVEGLYSPTENKTRFVVGLNRDWQFVSSVESQGVRFVPYSPHNNLLEHGVVLLPSEPEPYEDESELIAQIQSFIHRYVDVSPLFERVASYYVLLSWVYDSFNELPYLRLRGDPGSGKTRFLLTVGSICYKPIFASGASTVSPIFRILDAVRGTLVIDEGDFRFSDERAEIIKILNNGNAKGFPVLRSEITPHKEYNPRAYAVFGPKLVATRGYFEDRALESRCLTEEMGRVRLRRDIPISLPASWKQEALSLRNKLLYFRFRNAHRYVAVEDLVDRAIEPRLAQVFLPLLSIIRDESARAELRKLAQGAHRDLMSERGQDTEAQVLEVIQDLLGRDARLAVKEIASSFAVRFGDDYDQRITPRWIGTLIRRRLQLKTQKSHGVYVIPGSERPQLERLFERYGIGAQDQDTEESDKEPLASTNEG